MKELRLPLDTDCLAFYAANQSQVKEKLEQIMEGEGIKKSEYLKMAEELNRILKRFGGQVEANKPIKLVNTALVVPETIRSVENFQNEEPVDKAKSVGRTYWQKIVHKIDNYSSKSVPKELSIDVVQQLNEVKLRQTFKSKSKPFAKMLNVAEFARSQLSSMLETQSQAKLKKKKFGSFHISTLDLNKSTSHFHTPSLQSTSDMLASQVEPPTMYPADDEALDNARVGRYVASHRPKNEAKLRSTLATTIWHPVNKSSREPEQVDSRKRLPSFGDYTAHKGIVASHRHQGSYELKGLIKARRVYAAN